MPFSVEFNPPRDAAGEARLWRAARTFERMHPAFVSMTYGAGGTTRDRTVRITGALAEETTLLPVAHLTAVEHSVAELRSLVGAYADSGIRNILVLRGDPPGDPLGEWRKHPEGVAYAEELVRIVRDLGDFHVGVASFPQGHHRSPDLEHDTAYLAAKLRAGAEYSITQMFFDVEHYLRLRDRIAAFDPIEGAKPIIPELMPITSLRTVARAEELCGRSLPPAVMESWRPKRKANSISATRILLVASETVPPISTAFSAMRRPAIGPSTLMCLCPARLVAAIFQPKSGADERSITCDWMA